MLKSLSTYSVVTLSLVCVPTALVVAADQNAVIQEKKPATSLAFEMKSLAGEDVDLGKKYQDRVVLIVNVASECGLTPQYKQLQSLHDKYAKEGLAVLGFPCNQFGRQEPGSSEEIQTFCTKNYGVTFDMFEKIDVNGDQASPLYQYLTKVETKPKAAGAISWNFEKFLVDRSGEVVARFAPGVKPNEPNVIAVIEASLKQK